MSTVADTTRRSRSIRPGRTNPPSIIVTRWRPTWPHRRRNRTDADPRARDRYVGVPGPRRFPAGGRDRGRGAGRLTARTRPIGRSPAGPRTGALSVVLSPREAVDREKRID